MSKNRNLSTLAPANTNNFAVSTNASITGTLSTADVNITGNLVVTGTTVTVNVATLDVKDLNITVAKGAATNAAANGAGLTVDPSNAQLFYASSDNSWNFNRALNTTNTVSIGTAVYFAANGNVGIGNSAPDRKLLIQGTGASIAINAGGGAMSIDPTASGFSQIDVAGNNALRFNTNSNERVRIDGSGNVGIGTNNPVDKLHIEGNIYLGTTSRTIYQANSGNLILQTGTGNISLATSNGVERIRVEGSGGAINYLLNGTSGNITHAFGYNESGGEFQLIDNSGGGGILIDNSNGTARFYKVGSGVCEVGSTGGVTKVVAQGTAVAHFTSTTMSVNLGGTSTATIHAFRNGTSDYNNCGLQIQDNTSHPCIGFHAGGSTAVMLRHERGVNALDSVNSNQSAFLPFRASAFNVSSDYRIKENVEPLTNAVDRLMLLKPSRFEYKKDSMMKNIEGMIDGFLAHEVSPAVPEAVTGEKDAVDANGNMQIQSLDLSKLVPLLTASLQEAVLEIQSLKERIALLEK